MTARVKGFIITLEQDFREDDMDNLKSALEMYKYVAHVEPVLVTAEDHLNRMKIKMELTKKIFNVLK